ncbi:MAG: sugar phosphate isomerase/epimerase [Planctomycetes bacterium]|nr:sugar phosphate isomerase/epimerase [Planctomycetota bacterium]MCB9918282.1 sugar phosphate isomerase/epimerase [Planctomycetota bacterium]
MTVLRGAVSAAPTQDEQDEGDGTGTEAKVLDIRFALKLGMVGEGSSLTEKFALVKDIGYDGIEIDSPAGYTGKEARAASEETGLPIHGVVDSIHWRERLSSPDAEIRAKGIAGLERALRDAKDSGASTVLLVPGVVNKVERYDHCYERSQAEIRKALPLADELGIDICIENVWNNFLLSPLEMRRYLDELGPRVGSYFDIGNIVKYGRPSDWIRILGKRIKKLDVKGYHQKTGWCPIGEGTEDWPDVRAALREIGYAGWATAEVGGGNRERLVEVLTRMKKCFAD